MRKYNWEHLFEIGYTAEEMQEYENDGWADSVLELLSEADLADAYR